jgi:3-phosphoshikimate 1-carboxyvinyltransferase
MTTLVVHPADKPLTGSVPVASDESIGHRALLLGALGQGRTRLSGFTRAGGTAAMVECLRAMAVRIDAPSPSELLITGAGLDGLRQPAAALECRASEATLGLLCAVLAAAPFRTTLTGDETLSRRPLARAVAPLRARGAVIAGARAGQGESRDGGIFAPLVVGPLEAGRRLTGLQYESASPNAHVKSAVLLSGLYAGGPTLFKEPSVSPDHTERMLGELGVPVRTVGPLVQLDLETWDRRIPAFELAIPGDVSAAAVLVVAAQLVEGSRVTLRGVGTNPTRIGLLEIARDMGAGLALEPEGEHGGEPVALVHAWAAPLRAVTVGGETVARGIDDLPAACALAARAEGTTHIANAEDWGDGIAVMARVLRGFGVACEESPDGLAIEGRQGPLDGAEIASAGNARVAMTAAVLGLAGRSPSRVRDAACIADVFPKFIATLRALGARVDVG